MISLDLETTGLDPSLHEAWEVGLVDLKTNDEYLFEFPVRDLKFAEPGALAVNGYYDRSTIPAGSDICFASGPTGPLPANKVWKDDGNPAGIIGVDPRDAAFLIAKVTANQQLLGCNVGSFDAPFLAALLRHYDVTPAWQHRHLELGSYAAGQLNRNKPLSTFSLSQLFKFPDDAHTALGDARWNVDIYRNLIAQREGRA